MRRIAPVYKPQGPFPEEILNRLASLKICLCLQTKVRIYTQ